MLSCLVQPSTMTQAGGCPVGAILRGGIDDCGGYCPVGRSQVAPRLGGGCQTPRPWRKFGVLAGD